VIGLIDDLVDHAVATGEDAIPGLVTPLVQKAAEQGAALVPQLPAELQPIAQAVLDKIAASAPVLGNLSQTAVVGLVSKLTIGQGDAARLLYLRMTATHADRMAQLDQDSEATRKQASDRSDAWQKVKAFLEDIALTAGKALIPILVAL